MTATQDDTIAELQRANAEVRRERDAALAARNSEYGERIEHQAATIDVLKAMSASPGDAQPVFDLIVRHATELGNVPNASLFEYDGELVHLRSTYRTEVILAASPLAIYTKLFPMLPTRGSITCRAILDRQIVHVRDLEADHELAGFVRELGHQSQVSVPLIRNGLAIGVISVGSLARGGFSDSQVALLQTFAEQAVIAITSAETYRALQTRTSDLQETLEYQTATSDVLKVISRSTFDLQPVLETLFATAARLCGADLGTISLREGDAFRVAASYSLTPEYAAFFRGRLQPLDRGSVTGRTALEGRIIHVADLTADPEFALTQVIKRRETALGVPLLREGVVIGVIVLVRQQVQPFTDRQIELVATFADQALIAIENARLITEQREALEQQTATAEVLQVINANPGDLTPVFDAILDKAHTLCGAVIGSLVLFDGTYFRAVATNGWPNSITALFSEPTRPNRARQSLVDGERFVQIPDIRAIGHGPDSAWGDAVVESTDARTMLLVPLRKDGALLGFISAFRPEVRPFSEKEIALLENFAAQAVIAMENARLLEEVRQRQEELRITFENMGDGVAMFDEPQHLVAWNRKFQEIFNVPDALLEDHRTYVEYVRYLGARGDFGPTVNVEEQIRRFTETAGAYHSYERVRPDGRVIEIRHNPVAGGGFVLIYADITERKHNEAEIRSARDAAEEASRTIEAAFRDLKAAQANLIQAEKMASLGQLTAGIAHEIKNPLNFVNNFAALSVDLLSELKETAAPGFAVLSEKQRVEVEDVSAMLTSNLEKITEHGKRADGIVKAMLEHSRGSSGERRMVDLNALIDEALNLAYHGARAQDQSFNITLERDFDWGIAPIEVNPQDITRVFLNLFSNGFYAATRRARNGGDAGFMPTLKINTRDAGDAVEIHVRDNGTGIPADIKDKLFQPFFTTKPTGEGTGLGLSITYDIVTQQHGGSIAVDSKVGDYSEFTIRLPRKP